MEHEIDGNGNSVALYSDADMVEHFSISITKAGRIRREMRIFPAYSKGVSPYGQGVIPEIARDFLLFRHTDEYKKEIARIKKMKGKSK